MTRRERAVLIVGGSVIALAVGIRALPGMATTARERSAIVDQRLEVLAQSRAAAAALSALRDSVVVSLQALTALAPKLVEGGTTAEAGASLTSILSLSAERSHLEVSSIAPLPDSGDGVFRRVGVVFAAVGDLAGFVRLVRAVEQGSPLLSLRDVSIQAPEPGADPERLQFELVVTGLYAPRMAR